MVQISNQKPVSDKTGISEGHYENLSQTKGPTASPQPEGGFKTPGTGFVPSGPNLSNLSQGTTTKTERIAADDIKHPGYEVSVNDLKKNGLVEYGKIPNDDGPSTGGYRININENTTKQESGLAANVLRNAGYQPVMHGGEEFWIMPIALRP